MSNLPPIISSEEEDIDIETLHSRLQELTDIHNSCKGDLSGPSDSDNAKLIEDCSLHLLGRMHQVFSEHVDIDWMEIEDLDVYSTYLKEKLKQVEAESAWIFNEIEILRGVHVQELNNLERNIEGLKHALELTSLQDLKKVKTVQTVINKDDLTLEDHKFEILQLSDQIERNKSTLKSFQNLESILRRFEAVEKIEDAITGLKIVDFEGNHFRLSLRTHIPNLETLLRQHKVDTTEPSELNHELVVELMNDTAELKNVEISPNDVYIDEIVNAAKSLGGLSSQISTIHRRSPMEWFVVEVQRRIILSALRRYLVKGANKSRHSFEYLDGDEMIVAHMVGGVDAFLKVAYCWPMLSSALKLVSLKSLDNRSKMISLNFLYKAKEKANSLDACIRQNILTFVDAIEDILVNQISSGDVE